MGGAGDSLTGSLDFEQWNDHDDNIEGSALTGRSVVASTSSALTGNSGASVLVTHGTNQSFVALNPIESSNQRGCSPPSNNTILSTATLTPDELNNGSSSGGLPILTTVAGSSGPTEYVQMTTTSSRAPTLSHQPSTTVAQLLPPPPQPSHQQPTNLLLQHHQPTVISTGPSNNTATHHIQQVQFVNESLQVGKQGWTVASGGAASSSTAPVGSIILHDGSAAATSGSPDLIGVAGLTASPLADVLSSLPNNGQQQPMGVQNLTLPSTTLDLSDIKWGILDPTTVVSSIKRSSSMEEAHAPEERILIRDDI